MESRIQEALEYHKVHQYLSVSAVARQFAIPRGRLRYRMEGRLPKKGQPCNTTKLSGPEEKAICRYIDRLDCINLAVRPEFITDAANNLLRARTKDLTASVGVNWTTRFITRHKYHKMVQKGMEADRAVSEDIERVTLYFERLQILLEQEGIAAADIWNMDETGFRYVVGKNQIIVTKRKRRHYFGVPENRESCTVVEAIAADGKVCPAFYVMQGKKHMAPWYQQASSDIRSTIGVSETGYSNDELAMEWIVHFEKNTRDTTIGAKRLLLLDGHGSHHTKQFIQYCDNHDIIVFGMPPHLTHLLQPLDVVVFQPYKHYYRKAVDVMVRDGLVNITKVEFFTVIEDVRKKAFKSSTIISAFKKAGICPFNPAPILAEFEERAARIEATPPPPGGGIPTSSPFSTPQTVRQIHHTVSVIEDCLDYYSDTLEPIFATHIKALCRGSVSNVSELVQVKRDLGRTELAQKLQKLRKANKNTSIKSGGVLTIAEGREMVVERAQDKLEAARRMVEKAENSRISAVKRFFEAVAAKARKWRLQGVLNPAEILESEKPKRYLKRF